jgi:hypothetical protein
MRPLAMACLAAALLVAPQGAGATPPSCKSMCTNLAHCKIEDKAQCLEVCRREGVEQQPSAQDLLEHYSTASCEELQAEQGQFEEQQAAAGGAPPKQATGGAQPKQQPPPPPPPPPQEQQLGGQRPGWQCWAAGTWKQSCQAGAFCPNRIQSAFGFGNTQLEAQVSAETTCTKGMTSLMLASFGGRVVFPCKVTQCAQR